MKKKLLKAYTEKRNLLKSPEPSGREKNNSNHKLSFVIQEHHSSHLHWDFRLEWDGVLKSWAIPKGPADDPKIKRLAVQVEDHPLAYGKFHGTIPEGEYGAGKVYIWDRGTWEPEFDPATGLKNGKLEFTLKGKKLSGQWVLIRTHYHEISKQKNWLLIKMKDKKKILKNDKWPGFVLPQIPKLVTVPPTESDWVHEMKYDGYRLQTHFYQNKVKVFTRNHNDWSSKFPWLLTAVKRLQLDNVILDGELVWIDENGRCDFQKLQNALHDNNRKNIFRLKYYVFDILYLDGEDLRKKSLLERKTVLKKLLKSAPSSIKYSDHIKLNGKEFFNLTCEQKLEGIVSKKANAAYHSGRNSLWLKTKCHHRQEFVIGGYTNPEGSRIGFGALLLGIKVKGKLKYVGSVGTGFNHQSLIQIKKELLPLKQNHSPFDVKSPQGNKIHWLKPIKVAEVSFSQWTSDGMLRTPVFLGLRADKRPRKIIMEKSKIIISSPDKILFKDEKITKQQIVKFYDKISSHMLPYVANRPLSLLRCPQGSEENCFYQKHLPGNNPDCFHSVLIREKNGIGSYITIDSKEGLEQLVQLNAFELHEWNCHRENIIHPDQLVMDFDPGPGVIWSEVVQAAFKFKSILDHLHLKSFVKLTGGKGLHVHIPLSPLYSWEQIKSFAEVLARKMVFDQPSKYTVNMSKKYRQGKIFIDYLRNSYGATVVAPYSLRAKKISAVAMPIEWSELKKTASSSQFSMEKALAKLRRRKKDPWKGMLRLKQKIKILNDCLL